ncbi:MAPK kinase substrate protein At1g80180-like [Henckelia pumila]|uniref:MAPK kinase substrate protein At1g80180-like n=1 Tax=Henckelia pumila TaxID=405737 RepID=UPI003C6DEBAB
MAGLQRSEVSFRRQGSSGLVWDDKIVSGELNQLAQPKQEKNSKETQHQGDELKNDAATSTPAAAAASEDPARVPGLKIERSRSNGEGRGFRTGRVSPAVEPPSPKVSACGFCGAFGKNEKTRRQRLKPVKRVM